DRISVMRQGRIVATRDNRDITAEEIAGIMVGRSVLLRVKKGTAHPDKRVLLELDRLTASGDRGERAVDNLSLAVHAGEIVGLAGVQGNGQDELVECLAGLRRPLSGRIRIGGKEIARADPRDCRAAGLAYIPADRARVGLSLMSRVWENMTLGHLAEFRNGPLFAAG